MADEFHFGKPESFGVPLPLPVYWDHRVSGKYRSNLWGSIH